MEQKRIKVRLIKNSPYSEYGYYDKGDIGYVDGYTEGNAVIILENGKFAKADLRWIEVVNEEDKNVNTKLAESEDERIKGAIIDYLKDNNLIEWAVWLERQKEHKHDENSGKPSENVIEKENMSEYNKGFECGKQRVLKYPEDFGLCKMPADKVELKFKVGDWIICRNGEDALYQITDSIPTGYMIKGDDGIIHSVTFEQLVNCNATLSVIQNQKPTKWSEEDEKIYKKIETAIDSYYAPFSRDAEEMSEWFKNLKNRVQPQTTWKPSNEQFELLKHIIRNVPLSPRDKSEVWDLYLDLKRLEL